MNLNDILKSTLLLRTYMYVLCVPRRGLLREGRGMNKLPTPHRRIDERELKVGTSSISFLFPLSLPIIL